MSFRRRPAPSAGHRTAIVVIAVLVLGSSIATAGPAVADSTLDPAIEAQQLVYEVNLARWNPPHFAAIAGSDVEIPEGLLARPPQALNVHLGESAMFKANELAEFDYWAHQSAVTGMWPNELARSFGYALPSWWMDDANYIESLHAGSDDPIRVLASFAKSPGHRAHVFGEGGWSAWNEIGVGRSMSENFWSIHTAYREPTRTFVTGVVFDDRNQDGRMNMGEGVAGTTVRIGSATVTTNAGGGYSVVRGPGTYAASSPGAGNATVVVGQYNVGVDFIVGSDSPIVRAYELCNGEVPTMLGTSRDDVLYATPGRDVIHGLGGDDLVVGAGDDDLICSARTGATERLAGDDRFATAVEISQETNPDGADVVYIAVGTNYPDAIAAGSAAAMNDAPILLTHEDELPPVTESELRRLDPGLVVILGGQEAISRTVVSAITSVIPSASVERHAGVDRFATSAEVSRRSFPSGTSTVYVVSGLDFATALAAAPAAIANQSPMLLVPADGIPQTIITELQRLSPDRIVVVGSNEDIPDASMSVLSTMAPSVERIEAATGYTAAVAVSIATFPASTDVVYIAVGERFPDALAGGAATRFSPGPVLLVGPNHIPSGVRAELDRLSPSRIVIFGGPAAVSGTVEAQLGDYVAP